MVVMDWPNPDDRAFRATRRRTAAFQQVLSQYWAGLFHPRANGNLTAENALLDRGFGPACMPSDGLIDPAEAEELDALLLADADARAYYRCHGGHQ